MLYRLRVLLLVLTGFISVGVAQAESNEVLIDYDRQADQISLKEAEVSLAALLRKISVLSGVEIKLDPSLERQVIAGFEKKSVEQALLSIAKENRLNYLMGHLKDESGKNELAAFYILKQGEMSAAGLPPLVDPGFEALSQLRDKSEHGESHTLTRAYRRWESRFANLPPAVRNRMQENAEENIRRKQENDARSAQKRAESEARRAEKQAIRDARMEELKASDPQRYELKMQRQAELEQKALAEAERRRAQNQAGN